MTVPPAIKRPRGRPPVAQPLTAAERNKARRQRGARSVLLPPDAAADLAKLRQRDGDASNAAALSRLLRAALA